MCRLRNIAMPDYQESVTTGQTHRRMDGRTDAGQTPDKVIPMCHYAFAGNIIRKLWQILIFSNECHQSHDRKIDIDFFNFLRVICPFSKDIRIEVYFFCVCIGK